jgi:dipeptidyl aminopeptidase/acylaminoacyl peptidase
VTIRRSWVSLPLGIRGCNFKPGDLRRREDMLLHVFERFALERLRLNTMTAWTIRGSSLAWCFLLVAQVLGATPPQSPLRIEDAMGVLAFSNRTPIALSPDGEWVAYTVEDDRKRETTSDERYIYYTPTGAFTEAIGCNIWLTNTKTGQSRNLTEGKGTSWAPVWSPDGKYLAFYSDRSGIAHLWIWEKDGGQMRQLSEAIVRPFFNFQVIRWTPDSRSVLAKVLPEGMTLEQATDMISGPAKAKDSEKPEAAKSTTVTVYSFIPSPPPASGAVPQDAKPVQEETWMNRYVADLALIDVVTGTAKHFVQRARPLGYWISPDGAYVAYTHWKGTRENTQQTVYELRLVRLADMTSRTLVPAVEMEYGISVSWSPDSRSLAYLTSGKSTKGDCYLASIDGSDSQNLTAGEHPPFGDEHRAPLWDASGDYIYLISSENYGKLGSGTIWRASVRDRSFSVVTTIPAHVILEIAAPAAGGRYWSPDAGRSLVVGTRNENTKEVGFYKVDTSTGSSTKAFEGKSYFGRDMIFSLDVSRDGKTFVYVSQDAQHPEDVWVTSGDFTDRKQISKINPALHAVTFGASRVIDWYSVDGDLLRGALLLPANYQQGKKYPLIVDVYGGSYRSESVYRFGLSGSGVENLQLLATRGYAVLLPDTPLHDSTPMVDLLKTVIPGVDRAVTLGIADPDRLGVMGHSYGGYSTLSLIVQTTRFKAAVDSAGPADLISDYGIMDKTGSSWAIGWAETGQGKMGGTPWQFRDRYIANSPIFFLDRVQTPLLIVQGELDTAVPYQQANEVFVGLRRLGKEVVYARYAGEEHWEGTWGMPNVIDYWTRVTDWFDTHLKPAATQK